MRRRGCILCWLIGTAGFFVVAPAQKVDPPADALRPPTEAWLQQTLESDRAVRWSDVAQVASDAALVAAEANRSEAMEAWLLLARWARLFGTDQRVLVNRWIEALNAAELGHPNMARDYDVPAAPLSSRVSRAFALHLVADADFSRSFFDLLSPYDYLPGVLDILERLHAASAAEFERFEQVALAIAVVFDVPPPPQWPHGQVMPVQLSCQRPDPVQAFAFWTEADRRGQTLHRLNRLDAAELKFVVDAAAPFSELVWAQQQVRFDLAGLPRAYDAVNYATERVERGMHTWPGDDYRLATILATGGICIDQAYFASEVGKARGVPTLLFRGAGLDGRHAWFGYLDAGQKWRLDVGRYEEQKLVAGLAFDPQTWGNVNDHEITFLAERFRRLPAYRQSRAWQLLAQEQLRRGDAVAAVRSAERATHAEPRNVAAWAVLAISERAAELPAVSREASLRRAARALQRYPDLYVRFMREVIAVMRERGQASAATHEEHQLARKFSAGRSDLAVAQAAQMLDRSMAEDPPATQMRVFESALRQAGADAGMKAFDGLVKPMHRHALREGRRDDAAQVVASARRWLTIEPGSQLAREMEALVGEVRPGG